MGSSEGGGGARRWAAQREGEGLGDGQLRGRGEGLGDGQLRGRGRG